jgi:predicted Co/Zn/Cd cation transporter (cation efflux family)
MKGMLMLGVSMMALVGAVQTLLVGGRAIAAGIAIAYGVFACLTCGITAYMTRRGAQMTGSPMVQADADNWLVNTAYSACVLIAFLGILVRGGRRFARCSRAYVLDSSHGIAEQGS